MRPHQRRHLRPGSPWLVVHGLHRRVVSYLMLALMLGGLGGFCVHAVAASGWLVALVLLCIGVMVWALAWFATFRIAAPVVHLARVAQELRDGRLDARSSLTGATGEVGEVADALRGMADRVARQLRDQRALMAAVSHELRSPLARVRVLVELMREGAAPPDAHDRLQDEIDGMDVLVGDLLAAARIDFEAVSPEDLDAGELAARALATARCPPELLTVRSAGRVRADPTLASRALVVLLDNAARHGGRPVALTVAAGTRHVRFEVHDDGPGFAPGEEEQAFQPFWRGAGATRTRGEGLGLALVRQIAEAHGGSAGAGRRPEGGAAVWIELPTA